MKLLSCPAHAAREHRDLRIWAADLATSAVLCTCLFAPPGTISPHPFLGMRWLSLKLTEIVAVLGLLRTWRGFVINCGCRSVWKTRVPTPFLSVMVKGAPGSFWGQKALQGELTTLADMKEQVNYKASFMISIIALQS